jgi:hypothetical protein
VEHLVGVGGSCAGHCGVVVGGGWGGVVGGWWVGGRWLVVMAILMRCKM